ncbi:MAG: tetratricopeptide repeat protein [Deltaproteobacteria bacterium]|nr:tetratricopeptide repeat protein [Deltaproteobacteria bacterium]
MLSSVAAPTGTVSLVFTDIQGSTELWERYQDDFKDYLDQHNDIMRQTIADTNGYEVKTEGDAFMVAFANATEAADFCIQSQLRLHQAPWPDELIKNQATHALVGESADGLFRGLRVRMGIHTGAPKPQLDPITGRMDYFGPMVNRAARVGSVGHGGQIIVSQASWSQIRDRLGPDCIIDLGDHALKGLEGRERLFQIHPQQLALRAFPRIRTPDLNKTNLPTRLNSFIGRQTELQAIAQLFSQGKRMVTILGAGGTGKTRLCQRFGAISLGDFPGGVWFCDLTQATTLDGIVGAIGKALDMTLTQQDPIEAIAKTLNSRGRALLIIDNFEQVASFAVDTLGRWLNRTLKACFLVTSRERLRLEGESIFYLDPLSKDEAVSLFAERARAVRPNFNITDANRKFVEEIVERLDFMSLAIELAASRSRMMPPETMVKRLAERFKLLKGERRDQEARQATLSGAIEWSWQLLEPWEQYGLAQCSAFRGGFTLEAAESILDVDQWDDAPWTIDLIQALHDKSLLRMVEPVTGHERFVMYESIRQFAAEKLSQAGAVLDPTNATLTHAEAAAQLSERHGRYYARFGQQEYRKGMFQHGGVERSRLLQLELDNILSGFRHAYNNQRTQVACELYFAANEILTIRGPIKLASEIAARVLSLPNVQQKDAIMVFLNQGKTLRLLGKNDSAKRAYESALELSRESRDRPGEAQALGGLGIIYQWQGDFAQAKLHYKAALAIHRQEGNRQREGSIVGYLATVHRLEGDLDEAQTYYEAGLAVQRQLGNRRSEAIVLGNLGTLHKERGRMEEARGVYEAALDAFQATGNRLNEAIALANLGNLLLDMGDVSAALTNLKNAVNTAQELSFAGEGAFLGGLAMAHMQQGEMAEARTCIDRGNIEIKKLNYKIEEGLFISRRGLLEFAEGNRDEALGSYAEAQKIADELPSVGGSDFGKVLNKLKLVLSH